MYSFHDFFSLTFVYIDVGMSVGEHLLLHLYKRTAHKIICTLYIVTIYRETYIGPQNQPS